MSDQDQGLGQMHYPILRNSILDMDIRRNGITVVKLLF